MPSFGDRVRIKKSPETIAAGVAGLEGDVYGFTTPSSTGVDVIGGAPDDYALSISIDAHDAELWFRPDLAEFLDYNAGTEIVIGNVKAIRQPDGSWTETITNSHDANKTSATRTRWNLLEKLKRLFTRWLFGDSNCRKWFVQCVAPHPPTPSPRSTEEKGS